MVNYKFSIIKLFLFTLAAVLLVALCACQGKPDIKDLGEKTDNCISLNIINQTQKNIKSFNINTSSNTTTKLLEEDDIFYSDEERLLNYTLLEEKESTKESDAVIPVEYTIVVTYDDNTTSTVHGFPFKDTNQVLLKLDGNISYLEYYSNQKNKNISTLDSEKLILEKQAQDEAAAKAAAEEQAWAEANRQTYNYNINNSSTSDDSGCIGGGGLFN